MKKNKEFYEKCVFYIENYRYYEKLPHHLFLGNGLLKGVDSRLEDVLETWLFLPDESTIEMCEEMFPEDMIIAYQMLYLDIPYEETQEIKSLYDLACFFNKHYKKWETLEELVDDNRFVWSVCNIRGWDVIDKDEFHFSKKNKLITTKANENPLMVLYLGANDENDEYKDYEFYVKEVEV